MAKVTFTKRQLRLVEAQVGGIETGARAVMNSEGDNDTSSLDKDLSQVNQNNSDNSDVVIPTAQYTNKNLTSKNNGLTMTLKNNSGAAAQVAKIINNTNPNEMPGTIRLTNSVERKGNIVEVAKFNKKELDNFLRTL